MPQIHASCIALLTGPYNWGLFELNSKPWLSDYSRTERSPRQHAVRSKLALRAHALALQLALTLQIRLVQLVRVRVQRPYDAQHLQPCKPTVRFLSHPSM